MSEAVIPLAEPLLGGNAERYLLECLHTNFVSSVGPFVERFEQAFATYVGSGHAVACSSGTAALHVALHLLGVGPGDEVLVPTLTFIASANPVRYLGGDVTLVDAEPHTWNLDAARVQDELQRRAKAGQRQPKAVIAVHLLGHPAELEALMAACDHYGVPVIEDAAEALGARYLSGQFAGRQVGTIGRIGCFSFNGNKLITSGGGGMMTTDDPALARRAKHLTTQARLPGAAYWHDEIGYNYRLTNVAAALGLSQLEQIEALLAAKHRIADTYGQALAHHARVSMPPRAAWAEPSWWLYTLRLATGSDRDQALQHLQAAGIQSRPIWTPLHLQPPYQGGRRLGGHVAETIFATALSLPSSCGLTAHQQTRVLAAVETLI